MSGWRRCGGLLLVMSLGISAAACGDDSDDAGEAGSAEDGNGAESEDASAEVRVVDTPMGDVEVPVDLQDVATLWGPTTASAVQAGFHPVASSGLNGEPDMRYFPDDYEVDDIELVAEPREVNFEALAVVDPDLIIGAQVPHLEDAYDRLSDIAPTVLLDYAGTGAWRDTHVEVAEVLGVSEEEAQAAEDEYQQRVEEVSAAVGLDDEPMNVSLVRVQAEDEIRVETPESFPGQVLDDVGFDRPENQQSPDEDSDFISLSLERIPEVDAPTIIATYYFDGETQPAWESLQEQRLWQELPAVQSGDVIEADYEHWGASNYYAAHRILDDIEAALGS